MSTIRVAPFIGVLVVLTCVSPLFSAAGADRYRVTLVLYPGDDAAAMAQRLAAAYHGQLETPAGDEGTFLITLSPATAGLLARDPHVAQMQLAAVAPTAATNWNLGIHEYDGAGNVRTIGTTVYVYDDEGRLSYEKSGTQTRQRLTYDGFGNILSITAGGNLSTVGVSSSSNRADGSGTYDGAGNMTAAGTNAYTWDALNVMTRSTTDFSRAYVYNARDERVGAIVLTGPNGAEVSSQWTIRDPHGQVLRRFSRQGGQWRWMQDYIYRDGKMLASESNDQLETLHYHLDHLGTPRLITGNGGVEVARHTYYPFGEEVPGPTPQVAEPKKFTGHERDTGGLDYMLARYYLPSWGRFLSFDPHVDVEKSKVLPHRWNRYSYVMNNPLRYTDPDGRDERQGWKAGVVVNRSSQPVTIAGDVNGRVQVVQLQAGQSSTSLMRDADALIPNRQAMSFGPGIREVPVIREGALKIGFGQVTVSDSSTIGTLQLSASPGYMLSVFAMRAGVVSPQTARENGWIVPQPPQEQPGETPEAPPPPAEEKPRDDVEPRP